MNTKDLRSALKEIEEIFAAAGAKGQQQDLHAMRQLLEGYDDEELDKFLEDVRSSASKGERIVLPIEPDEKVVKQWVDRLIAAGSDSSAFDIAIRGIVDNTSIRKVELQAIATKYVNGRRRVGTKDSKSKLLETIRAHFNELLYEKQSRDRARRATPW